MEDIFLVNCFCTETKDSGNPAAIVTNFSGKNADCLTLAKKLGTPVTVFISDLAANEPVLKFFYPDTQMPLCLHGALAAAKILFFKKDTQKLICFTEEGKELSINESDQGYLQIKVCSQDCEKNEIKKQLICEMLNLSNSNSIVDDLPFCVSSVGSPKLIVPLNSLRLLSELQPNYELIKKWSIENKVNGIYVYTNETYLDSSDFHARGFNPKTGHNEDAATGVAAAALSLALQKNIKVEQGYFIKRPCSIIVSYINPNKILVGGEVSILQRLS